MNKPQGSLSVQLTNEWKIRRPQIYRYLEKEFVDEFFETGRLRISSFNTFSQHGDEQRNDGKEGKGTVIHTNHEGDGQTFMAAIGQGHNAYVLCGATYYSDEIAKDFNTNSGFRINDLIAFSHAISRYIPGFRGGIEGPCLYQSQRTLSRDMGKIDLDDYKISEDSNNLDMNKMMGSVFQMAGDDLFFLKEITYAKQSEYRLLWFTPSEVDSHIDIVCPDAIQFCTKFEDLYGDKD